MGGGGGQTTGVRVHAGSEPHVSLLPHQSSVCFSSPNFQRHCDSEECATVCNSLSARRGTFTAVACGTLGHVKLRDKSQLSDEKHQWHRSNISCPRTPTLQRFAHTASRVLPAPRSASRWRRPRLGGCHNSSGAAPRRGRAPRKC